MKIKGNKGILFWITGLSGSGKTTLAKRIMPFIKKKYGSVVHLDGDVLRNILVYMDIVLRIDFQILTGSLKLQSYLPTKVLM